MADLRAQLQTTLGDAYTLERELGGGGMSRVFVALETRLQRKVVVKVLSPDLAQGISIERFEREIQLAASLQQANIVPVLTAGDTEGLPFYTMPFVEGESLRNRLANGPLSITDVVSVLRDVSRALSYAHSRDVVHRDIKPDNVLLSAGTAVVTDFGIAKALSAARTGQGGATLTQVGTSIGTPAYMAPEQAAGDPDIDFRADIYALGCVAYELLSGQAPFAGRTAQRALAAHLSEAPRPIGELRPDTPAPLANLVMQCLEKEPGDRPQSATDLARSLDAITSGQLSSMPAILGGGPGAFQRALLWYAGAFVAVAILAKAAIVGIGLPSWVFPGALVVMALGLPMILFTAYSQRVARSMATATPTMTPGGGMATAAPQGTMATMAIKASPHLSWKRTRTGGVVAFGGFLAFVAGFMVLRSLGIGPSGSLLASGKLDRQAPILVTDFVIRNADTSLATVLSGAARSGLGQSAVIKVVSPAEIAGQLARMERPVNDRLDRDLAREIAPRIGSPAIVEGEATGVGDGFIVSLRLVTADEGRELASFQETGDGPKGLIDAVGTLTKRLRDRIGESLRDVQRTPPLSEATTSSLEALRAYTKANWANDVERDFAGAAEYARQAVALDSNFAEGWRKVAVALSNNGAATSVVHDAMRRAFSLRDRLPTIERLQVEASYYNTGPGRDRAKAIEIYREMMERGDSISGNNLALGLMDRRDWAEAESVLRIAIRSDSTFSLPRGHLVNALIGQGKIAEAEAAVAALQAEFPGPVTDMFISALRANQGDLAALDSIGSELRQGEGYGRRGGLGIGAGVATTEGRLADAVQFETERGVENAAAGIADPPVVDSVQRAHVDAWARGRPADGAARIDGGMAATAFDDLPEVERPYLDIAIGYAMNGRPDKARAMVARYRAEVTDTALLRFNEPTLHTVLGEIALAEGKTAEALREFRLGDVAPDGPATGCNNCLALELARTFDAAGEVDSAIAQFEAYLATPTPVAANYTWLRGPVAKPYTHRRLGELYEAKGDRQRALDHYQAFVDLWRDADPELQPIVSEVRRRMAALGEP